MAYVARRRLPDDPVSKLAVWARWVAVFAIPVVLLAIIISRFGFLELTPSLATLGGALFLAALAVLLALASFVVIWREGHRGIGLSVTAVAIGVAILAYPSYFAVKAYRLPALNDITTDPTDPPRFDAIARLRPRNANPLAYPGAPAAELQRKAYPDVEPVMIAVTPEEAFDAAYAVMAKHKWRVVDARKPQPGRRDGMIEAVARTPIMGFPDDVVVRVRTDEDGARIDIRSASRYGGHDFGANASRVRALAEEIDDMAGVVSSRKKKAAAKAAKPEPPPRGTHAPVRR
jgi:uncharacterized protein (DUF1499 family)